MNQYTRILPALLPVALALSACSQQPADQQPSAAPPPTAATSEAVNEAALSTRGGDGSEIMLTELTEQDFAANPLEGELACSFGENPSSAPLLVARGFADDSAGRAQGLARIGDYPQRLMAMAPGGFDAMIVGARFGGQGMTYTITLDRSEVTGGGESPSNPARLLLQRADGAERTIPGTWTCGP